MAKISIPPNEVSAIDSNNKYPPLRLAELDNFKVLVKAQVEARIEVLEKEIAALMEMRIKKDASDADLIDTYIAKKVELNELRGI